MVARIRLRFRACSSDACAVFGADSGRAPARVDPGLNRDSVAQQLLHLQQLQQQVRDFIR
eukprot:3482125-Rhodomonas_salina.1